MCNLSHPLLLAKSTDTTMYNLRDHGAGSRALVPPGWWENSNSLVVAGEAVNAGLDENQTELGVLVLAVSLQVLADSDSLAISIRMILRFKGKYNSNSYLLDQHVEILRDFWGEACRDHSVSLKTKQRLDCTGWKMVHIQRGIALLT